MVHYNHLDLAPEFVFFFANRLPFLMVLLWVVEEVFRFLEHFALQLIEQYVNIFCLICFFFYIFLWWDYICYFSLRVCSISWIVWSQIFDLFVITRRYSGLCNSRSSYWIPSWCCSLLLLVASNWSCWLVYFLVVSCCPLWLFLWLCYNPSHNKTFALLVFTPIETIQGNTWPWLVKNSMEQIWLPLALPHTIPWVR